MPLPLDDARKTLLDFLSPLRPAELERLEERDWESFLLMARQHRLGPLLHWRLTHEKADARVPGAVRAALAGEFKSSVLRSLAVQRELLLAGKILDGAGIPCVALKGAFLALHAYPHPALRPLRDVDILVPKESALRAYQALIDGGCRRQEKYPREPKDCLASLKNLPPLMSASGTVRLELHPRLTETRWALSRWESLVWGRLIARPTAGQSLHYLSPTDLLLHLIIHSVYDHRFDNGPLVLTDLHYLMKEEAIDWTSFWSLAREGGYTKGCLLLLNMTQRYCGGAPIDGTQEAEAAADDYSALMLRDMDSGVRTRLAARLAGKSPLQKFSILFDGAFPPQDRLAAGYLPARAKVIARRLPGFFAKKPKDADALARLERWLSA